MYNHALYGPAGPGPEGSTSMRTRLSRRELVLGLAPAALALNGTRVAAQVAAPVTAPLAGQSRPDRAAAAAGSPLARLLANENPYGPSPAARQALEHSIDQAWQYPGFQAGNLKELIAAREGLSPAQVMIGDGSGEILRIAAVLYGRDDGEVLSATPTFGFLQDYVRRLGGTVREVPLDEAKRHDLGAMASALGPRTRLVYVCNPNNPTGTLLRGAELRPFVQEVSRKAAVLVDEAYLDLAEDWRAHTLTDRVAAGDPVIVTRTFSKLHGLAGLRIGYALAPAELIQRLEQHRMSLLNLPGLLAATASYQDLDFQALSRARIQEGLRITGAALEAVGRPHVPVGPTNFVFFDTGGPLADFAAAMRREGYLVGRPFPPYDTWCRVSMGTVAQMQGFAAALGRYYG